MSVWVFTADGLTMRRGRVLKSFFLLGMAWDGRGVAPHDTRVLKLCSMAYVTRYPFIFGMIDGGVGY